MRSKLALVLMLAATLPAHAADLAVTDGWFRALPPAVPSGGYFTLRNGGAKSVTLTDVESPACGMLMMHKSENGRMDHVETLDVAGGETIRFAPNGLHLMCMGSTPLLKPGNNVPVTLTFSDKSKLAATFKVRNAAGR